MVPSFDGVHVGMKYRVRFSLLLLLGASFGCLLSCGGNKLQDTLIASVANPSHTYRATIVLRQYFVDGRFDESPTTYVLLDRESESHHYARGVEFKDAQVVMKPTQCGPLSVQWSGDTVLGVRCDKCGLALAAVGRHAESMGPIRIEYDGFPEMSSWETGRSH
jgi:hypothetical protein